MPKLSLQLCIINSILKEQPTINPLDWLYPPTCMACRTLLPLNNKPQRDLWLCTRCQELFEPVTAPMCNKCGMPTENPVEKCSSCYSKTLHFNQNRAAFTYNELMRDMMHELKFRNKKYIAQGLGRLWAHLLQEICYTSTITDIANYIFVPLPMHKKKQKERGFNQAEILTTELSKALKIPAESTLERILDTPPQSGLHPQLRAENVEGVFTISPNFNPAGKSYILIDDIYTTGASLNECARTLKNAGAYNILCMTLAITVKTTNDNQSIM